VLSASTASVCKTGAERRGGRCDNRRVQQASAADCAEASTESDEASSLPSLPARGACEAEVEGGTTIERSTRILTRRACDRHAQSAAGTEGGAVSSRPAPQVCAAGA
jgi:hypothetical protein